MHNAQFRRTMYFALAGLLLCIQPNGGAGEPNPSEPTDDAGGWSVELQQRMRPEGGGEFEIVRRTVTWEPAKTAIVVVDMWDNHHCKSAAQRVTEMAPAMNTALEAARARGVLVIHSPSDCMPAYQDLPARRRAEEAPEAKALVEFHWNYFDPQREGPLDEKLEKAGCSCDSPEPCGPDKRVWQRETPLLEIADEDAVSDNGQEVFNLLEARGIENVIVMGVHTNRCVLGRPFGIRQMAYLGKNVVLCRDLTDSYHRDPGHHFEGLRQIIAHVEKYWCPTIASEALTGRAPFRFAADQGDR